MKGLGLHDVLRYNDAGINARYIIMELNYTYHITNPIKDNTFKSVNDLINFKCCPIYKEYKNE